MGSGFSQLGVADRYVHPSILDSDARRSARAVVADWTAADVHALVKKFDEHQYLDGEISWLEFFHRFEEVHTMRTDRIARQARAGWHPATLGFEMKASKRPAVRPLHQGNDWIDGVSDGEEFDPSDQRDDGIMAFEDEPDSDVESTASEKEAAAAQRLEMISNPQAEESATETTAQASESNGASSTVVATPAASAEPAALAASHPTVTSSTVTPSRQVDDHTDFPTLDDWDPAIMSPIFYGYSNTSTKAANSEAILKLLEDYEDETRGDLEMYRERQAAIKLQLKKLQRSFAQRQLPFQQRTGQRRREQQKRERERAKQRRQLKDDPTQLPGLEAQWALDDAEFEREAAADVAATEAEEMREGKADRVRQRELEAQMARLPRDIQLWKQSPQGARRVKHSQERLTQKQNAVAVAETAMKQAQALVAELQAQAAKGERAARKVAVVLESALAEAKACMERLDAARAAEHAAAVGLERATELKAKEARCAPLFEVVRTTAIQRAELVDVVRNPQQDVWAVPILELGVLALMFCKSPTATKVHHMLGLVDCSCSGAVSFAQLSALVTAVVRSLESLAAPRLEFKEAVRASPPSRQTAVSAGRMSAASLHGMVLHFFLQVADTASVGRGARFARVLSDEYLPAWANYTTADQLQVAAPAATETKVGDAGPAPGIHSAGHGGGEPQAGGLMPTTSSTASDSLVLPDGLVKRWALASNAQLGLAPIVRVAHLLLEFVAQHRDLAMLAGSRWKHYLVSDVQLRHMHPVRSPRTAAAPNHASLHPAATDPYAPYHSSLFLAINTYSVGSTYALPAGRDAAKGRHCTRLHADTSHPSGNVWTGSHAGAWYYIRCRAAKN